MRVIAGKYKGRRLTSPEGNNVRPTTDRIKETVFNILQWEVEGAVCLDLFAGSGALGIECLSRGAKEVVFVDKSPQSVDLVKTNLKGIDGNYRVLSSDFLSALRSFDTKFDLIFIDPPYQSNLGLIAVEYILDKELLKEGGIIYFEHGDEITFTAPKGYKTRTKKMGYTIGEFITKKRVAMLTGSFDPITKGHEALIDEGLMHFDEVVVACLVNEEKEYFFTPEERVAIVSATIKDKKGVRAIYSTDMAVDVAKREGAEVFIRGVRGDEDRAYEEEIKQYNLTHGGVDTIIYELDTLHTVSSTRAREEILKGDYRSIPASAVLTLDQIVKNKMK